MITNIDVIADFYRADYGLRTVAEWREALKDDHYRHALAKKFSVSYKKEDLISSIESVQKALTQIPAYWGAKKWAKSVLCLDSFGGYLP